MKHLSDEELYVLSQTTGGHLASHLRECERCSASYREFAALLESAATESAMARPDPDLSDRVWAAIHPSLPIYGPETRRRRSFSMFAAWSPRGLAWAGALGVLVLIGTAFWVGRLFEERRRETNLALQTPSQPARVVLLVVREHLDRSERLLVELDHAGRLERVEGGPLVREATDLLEDNRLYRQTTAVSQDRALAGLLDRLDRALVEVSHDSGALQGGDFARMRQQMNLDGLLFELRVLRDRHIKSEKETRL